MRKIRRAAKTIIAASILASTLWSCEIKRPENVLSPNKMEKLLYDYHLASTMANELNYNQYIQKEVYVRSVLKKNNTTKEEFDNSLVWYANHPELMYKIYTNINQQYKEKGVLMHKFLAMQENLGDRAIEGDSVELWYKNQVYFLSNNPLVNKIDFNLTADTTYHIGDTIRWTVRTELDSLITDSMNMPIMAMQVAYKKDDRDSIISRHLLISNSGYKTLESAEDSLGNVSSVRGFIYIPKHDSINTIRTSMISLMRFHRTDSISTDSVTTDK